MLTKSKIYEKRIFDIVPFVNHYMHTNIPSLIILHYKHNLTEIRTM